MKLAVLPDKVIVLLGNPIAPPGVDKYAGGNISGITLLLGNILKFAIYGAGLFALINLVVSGIQYIGSSGNPELLKQASSRIWLSLLGLIIIAAVFIITGLIGWIFFKDALFLINLQLPNPNNFSGN